MFNLNTDVNKCFLGGKMEPYVKRCAASKITSAEKLMYICKNQLGMLKPLYFNKFNVLLCVNTIMSVENKNV